MSRTVVVDLSVRLTFHVVVVAAIYLTFAGHNQPGGGFVGGLLMGSAIAMRYAAGGIEEVRAISRVRPWTILGAGLLLAATTAALPLLFGHEVLEAAKLELDVPLLGAVKLPSTLAFDLGVFLLVVGLVLMVFEAFGDDPSLDQGEGSRA
jgi:multicomponent Na+:H+ antiporter subunit A